MALFKINKILQEEIRRQRKTIFGNKRYLFHILSWIIALWYLGFAVFGDVNAGFDAGVKDGMKTHKILKIGSNDSSTTLKIEATTGLKGVRTKEPSVLLISIIGTFSGSLMVYFYLLYVIPFARYKKQRRQLWFGVLLNIAIWLIIIILGGFFIGLRSGKLMQMEDDDIAMTFLLSAVFSGITALYFFSLYYFLDLYDQQKGLNRYRDVLTEKLRAETDFLKTQINPHFLFNTLNNIYSLTLSRSDDAAVITGQLKELIIYMLQECKKDTVPLAGEIEFLKNYINLEQLRNKQEQVAIELQIKGDPAGKEVAPLLLVNFIENAFKHGVKAGIEQAFVRINLLIMDNTLSLDMINSKPPAGQDQSQAVKEHSGIGIKNVVRRLDILYPGRHKLRISQSAKDYSVYLTLDL